MPFDFNYAVKDDQYGNDYSHNAVSDGDVTRGEYRIQLPDGRTQIVKYTADWKSGFHAQVRYEGTPTYPNYQARPSNQSPTNTGYPGPSSPPQQPQQQQPLPRPSGPPQSFQPQQPAKGYPTPPRPSPSFPSPQQNQIPSQPFSPTSGYKY